MSSIYRCAIRGFAASQEPVFAGFFRMTANLGMRFELVHDVVDAQILILNADDPPTVQAYLAKPQRPPALFIGEHDVGPPWPRLTHPLRLTKVLQTLQSIASALPTRHAASHDDQEGTGARVASRALIIDDNDIALRSATTQVRALGLEIDTARSGEEAMVLLHQRTYAVVFIDVMMEGLDGYQTCKVVKQRKYADNKLPVAIMLSSRSGAIDRIRGSLAGCDAYLTKPLEQSELIKVLHKHALVPSPAISPPTALKGTR